MIQKLQELRTGVSSIRNGMLCMGHDAVSTNDCAR